jgi:phage/plasmid-like protein (TIGR03299 family)
MVAAVTVRKDGFAEMAYVGQVPWHGLGQALAAGAPIETWLTQAGLDWTVKQTPVCFRAGPTYHKLTDKQVLFRSDTQEALGVVSNKYKVVQPKEVLEFFRDLVGVNGYELNTAGTLGGGKKFWALASVGEEAAIIGDDTVRGFLLLATSCDGSLSTTARFVIERVVCQNTLEMAMGEKTMHKVNVSHRSQFSSSNVKAQLGLAEGSFREFLVAARRLAKVAVTKEQAETFTGALLRDHGMIATENLVKSKPVQSIQELFLGAGLGAELLGVAGTAWGLVNAITEYIDHRAKSKSDSHRLDNAWFGLGAQVKTAAMTRALELV